MPLTGSPLDLSGRSFDTASPLYTGLKCWFHAGQNKNLLPIPVRDGTLKHLDNIDPTFAYVAGALPGVTGSKALSPATFKDYIKLSKPTTPAAIDLPGTYGDFTVLWYGTLQSAQNTGCLFNIGHETNDEYIRLSYYPFNPDTPGSESNIQVTVKTLAGSAENFFAGGAAVKGEYRCYAVRRSGTELTIFRNAANMGGGTVSSGNITLDGTVLLGVREEFSWGTQNGRADHSLLVIYNRALTNTEIATLTSFPLTVLPDAGTPPPQLDTKRFAWMGNSVSDTFRCAALKPLALTHGSELIWARHMIPGAPLVDLINNPPVFTEQPYGAYPGMLTGYNWDTVSLQPFDRKFNPVGYDLEPGSDTHSIKTILDQLYSRPGNTNTRVLIYSRWARRRETMPGSGVYAPYDCPGLWAQNYVYNSFDLTNETKEYFEPLFLKVRSQYPTKTVDLLPVGDAVLLFDSEAKAGNVPGFSSAEDLFTDGIHFFDPTNVNVKMVGAYLVSCVLYATLYKKTPVGLGYSGYTQVTASLALKLQQIAWATVNNHPYSGVGTPPIIEPPIPPSVPGMVSRARLSIKETDLCVSYDEIKIMWGQAKLTRLSHIENPEDEFALKERIWTGIYKVQSEIFGFFGETYPEVSADILGYTCGILPTFLEYRLNPTEALKDEVDLMLDAMKEMKRDRFNKLKLAAGGDSDGGIGVGDEGISMFVV
jgi:hypothetical protein